MVHIASGFDGGSDRQPVKAMERLAAQVERAKREARERVRIWSS
jgi:hypothetical protein